jgi:hypothetical protein
VGIATGDGDMAVELLAVGAHVTAVHRDRCHARSTGCRQPSLPINPGLCSQRSLVGNAP